MASITNWATGAAGGAYDADMKRNQLALQAERQRQEQQRWEAERRYKMQQDEETKRWQERVYNDQRADLKYQRGVEERKYNDQRADLNYQRGFDERKYDTQRADAQYKRDFDEREYQNRLDQDAFDNEIKAEKANQATALFEREMEAYNQLAAKREADTLASRTSLAAALAYAIRNGDRDAQGRIYLPTDAVQVFNSTLAKATGVNQPGIKGMVLITKNADGTPLNGMQVALLRADGGHEVIPQNELMGLVESFPTLNGEYAGLMGQLFPKQEQQFDKNYYNYLNDSVKSAEASLKNEYGKKDTLTNEYKNPTAVARKEVDVDVARLARDIYAKTGYKPTYEEALAEYQRINRIKMGLEDDPVTSNKQTKKIDDDLDL